MLSVSLIQKVSLFQTAQVAWFDANIQKYVAYRRMHTYKALDPAFGRRQCRTCVGKACGPGGFPTRTVGRCTSDDFIDWPGCDDLGRMTPGPGNENCSMVLGFDRDDDPCLDIYLSSAIPYFGEHYLAFPAAFMHFPNVPIWRNDNDGMWDVKLVHSRTGLDLQYIGGDRSQWIPRGTMAAPTPNDMKAWPVGNAWDSAMTAMARGLLRVDGKLRMWKYGDVGTHSQEVVPGQLRGGFAPVEVRAFAGMRSVNTRLTQPNGSFTTTVLPWKRSTLPSVRVNVETTLSGGLLVELLDAEGSPLPGHALTDCANIIGDFEDAAVTWLSHAGHDTEALAGDGVRLRFVMMGRVHLFGFALKSDDIVDRLAANAPLRCDAGRNCSALLQSAIDSAAAPGGSGALTIAGVWTTVPIQLRSNLLLQLSAGTTVMAQRGAFHGSADALFAAVGV